MGASGVILNADLTPYEKFPRIFAFTILGLLAIATVWIGAIEVRDEIRRRRLLRRRARRRNRYSARSFHRESRPPFGPAGHPVAPEGPFGPTPERVSVHGRRLGGDSPV